jgi:hypothetical protein
MGHVTVTRLAVYPIKSCAAVYLPRARLTPRGLELDREFMLVDDDDDFLSQRKVPELALIVPTLGHGHLTLNAPGMPSIQLPLQEPPDDSRRLTATLHGKTVTGQLAPDHVSAWFARFLPAHRGRGRYRLLRVREDVPRHISERYRIGGASNLVGFADGSAILLASDRSLAELNTHMQAPVPMDRFRANIVIDGPQLDAYEEDHWLELDIGSLRVHVTKACDRCSIPDVDQASAATGKAVRRALVTRRGFNAHDPANTGVFFAQNLNHVHVPGATVGVGDAVRVIRRAGSPNVVLGSAVAGAA